MELNKSKIKFFLFLSFFSPIFIFHRTNFDESKLTAYISILSIIIIFLTIRFINKINYQIIKFLFPFILLFTVGLFVTIVRDFEILNAFNRSLPIIFFCLGFILITSYYKLGHDSRFLCNLLFYLVLFSTVYQILFSIFYYKISLFDMRYQILPKVINYLFCFFCAGYVMNFRKKSGIICLLLFIIVTLVSATRNILLMSIIIFYISIFLKNEFNFFKSLISIFKITFIIALIIYFIPDNFYIDKMTNRILISEKYGYDPTFNSRFYEILAQIKMLKSNTLSLLFGFGFVQPIEVFGYDLNTKGSFIMSLTHGYGHNLYVGMFFVSGIFIGFLCNYVLISTLFKTKINKIIFFINDDKKNDNEKFLLIFFYLSFLSFLIINFFGSTFGDKSGSFYFGISIGILRLFNSDNKTYNFSTNKNDQ